MRSIVDRANKGVIWWRHYARLIRDLSYYVIILTGFVYLASAFKNEHPLGLVDQNWGKNFADSVEHIQLMDLITMAPQSAYGPSCVVITPIFSRNKTAKVIEQSDLGKRKGKSSDDYHSVLWQLTFDDHQDQGFWKVLQQILENPKFSLISFKLLRMPVINRLPIHPIIKAHDDQGHGHNNNISIKNDQHSNEIAPSSTHISGVIQWFVQS